MLRYSFAVGAGLALQASEAFASEYGKSVFAGSYGGTLLTGAGCPFCCDDFGPWIHRYGS